MVGRAAFRLYGHVSMSRALFMLNAARATLPVRTDAGTRHRQGKSSQDKRLLQCSSRSCTCWVGLARINQMPSPMQAMCDDVARPDATKARSSDMLACQPASELRDMGNRL